MGMLRRPLVLVLFSLFLHFGLSAGAIGINYGGTVYSSKPLDAPTAVTAMKKAGMSAVKLFVPEDKILRALAGSGLDVVLGSLNADVIDFAYKPGAALRWVDTNVLPYTALGTRITLLSLGNEVYLGIYGGQFEQQVMALALERMEFALSLRGLSSIKISTSLAQNFYFAKGLLPSTARLLRPATLKPLLAFLKRTGAPFMINPYPYFAVQHNRPLLPLSLFRPSTLNFYDKGFWYWNLLDVLVDSALWSMEAAGFKGIPIVLAETGWPTAGGSLFSPATAQEYNSKLVGHVLSGQGTPRLPGVKLPTYLFEMFDEDRKSSARERSWGLETMRGVPKYKLNVTAGIPPVVPAAPQRWCIPNSRVSVVTVSKAVAEACRQLGRRCAAVLSGGCKTATGARRNAVILNAYFQAKDQAKSACPPLNLTGSTIITASNPSRGSCILPGRPPVLPPVVKPFALPDPGPEGALWCVAKNGADPAVLANGLNYACGPGGVNCFPTTDGQACSLPNTLQARAGWAFNEFYRASGRKAEACFFGGSAVLTSVNPSSPTCHWSPLFCVAKPTASAAALQGAISYVCREGGVNCALIQPGAACGKATDTLAKRASWAVNAYFQKERQAAGSCGFGGAAMLSTRDPSTAACHFPFY